MALLFLLTGWAIVLVAMGVIPVPEKSFEAPRWVVGVLGAVFLVGGFALLLMAAEGVVPEALRQGGLYLVVLVMVGGFALVFNWAAFGSGERAFSGSFSLFFFTFSPGSGDFQGRLAFGCIALGLDVLFFVMLVRGVIGLARYLLGVDGSL